MLQDLSILMFSGGGKSTLLSILAGLYDCTSGNVSINGVDRTRYNHSLFRDNVIL